MNLVAVRCSDRRKTKGMRRNVQRLLDYLQDEEFIDVWPNRGQRLDHFRFNIEKSPSIAIRSAAFTGFSCTEKNEKNISQKSES